MKEDVIGKEKGGGGAQASDRERLFLTLLFLFSFWECTNVHKEGKARTTLFF
jgi:hypothetical protein